MNGNSTTDLRRRLWIAFAVYVIAHVIAALVIFDLLLVYD